MVAIIIISVIFVYFLAKDGRYFIFLAKGHGLMVAVLVIFYSKKGPNEFLSQF